MGELIVDAKKYLQTLDDTQKMDFFRTDRENSQDVLEGFIAHMANENHPEIKDINHKIKLKKQEIVQLELNLQEAQDTLAL